MAGELATEARRTNGEGGGESKCARLENEAAATGAKASSKDNSTAKAKCPPERKRWALRGQGQLRRQDAVLTRSLRSGRETAALRLSLMRPLRDLVGIGDVPGWLAASTLDVLKSGVLAQMPANQWFPGGNS
jgi:hypothetical protein